MYSKILPNLIRFGSVYKGIITPLSEMEEEIVVAVKELHLEGSENSSIINDKWNEFCHEVSIMSKLNHNNIVQLYGITST